MKSKEDEKMLFKKALEIGEALAIKSGFTPFKTTDSIQNKTEAIYRFLVHIKIMTQLPLEQENQKNMKQRLIKWISTQIKKQQSQ